MSKDSWFLMGFACLAVVVGGLIAFAVPEQNIQRVATGMNTALIAGLFLVTAFYAMKTSHIARETRHQAEATMATVGEMRKPIITTKVISREARVDETPTVLITGDPYLVVSNMSTNQATNLWIDYEFWLEDRRIAKVNKRLRYLNPREATKEPIPLGEIVIGYPSLFQEIKDGKVTKKIPKNTLALFLTVTVRYSFPQYKRYKIVDSYKIEWGSLESYPQFENHPMINCWNVRDELYIYKLGEIGGS